MWEFIHNNVYTLFCLVIQPSLSDCRHRRRGTVRPSALRPRPPFVQQSELLPEPFDLAAVILVGLPSVLLRSLEDLLGRLRLILFRPLWDHLDVAHQRVQHVVDARLRDALASETSGAVVRPALSRCASAVALYSFNSSSRRRSEFPVRPLIGGRLAVEDRKPAWSPGVRSAPFGGSPVDWRRSRVSLEQFADRFVDRVPRLPAEALGGG